MSEFYNRTPSTDRVAGVRGQFGSVGPNRTPPPCSPLENEIGSNIYIRNVGQQ
jgi:hypothetical protein